MYGSQVGFSTAGEQVQPGSLGLPLLFLWYVLQKLEFLSPGVCVHCSVSHLLGLLSQSALMEIETPIKICFSMACINDLVRLFELY